MLLGRGPGLGPWDGARVPRARAVGFSQEARQLSSALCVLVTMSNSL